MFKKKLSASLTALALFGFAMGAEAIALGDLNIESKLGEPFEAKLEIVDVDPTISPLLVRIAPPSVYEREQQKAPDDIYALKMERLSTGEKSVLLRVYSDAPMADNRFPLLVEMNAGGTLSIKNYDLAAAFETAAAAPAPEAERTVLHEADVPVNKAAKSESDEEKAARLALDRQQDKEFRYPTARSIVQDYIALNGFDATQPMKIQKGMTLWSVARAYWPSYRGATAEQILIGFRNQNRAAFVEGDPGRLQVGAMLYPPAKDDVFAINPMEAFRSIHGDNVAIPLVTQNLIDAQLVDTELAGSVADAQDRARTAGENPQTIAAAGRTALEDKKAERVYERQLMSDDGKPLGEPRQTLTETPAAEAPAVKTEAVIPDPKAVQVEDKKAADAKPEAAPAEKPVVTDKAKTDEKKAETKQKEGFNWTWIMGILLLLGFIAFFRNRFKSGSCCEDKENGKPCCCGKPVTVQKDIPPSSDAQLKALKTTVDEAVKNGTTGGAMGAGTMAFVEAQMAEAKKTDEEKAFKADGKSEPVIVPVEAEMSEEDREALQKSEDLLKTVSLDLDDDAAEKPASAEGDKAAEPANESAPEKRPEDSAYTAALDARIQLAEGFIKYGAVSEANEVFDEVMRLGTAEQKARVTAIRAQMQKDGVK